MLFIWRFIIGYLEIIIYSENCERLLNNAAANGIKIWDLHYKNGHIYGKISRKNFLNFFHIRHKTNCKIKIAKKHGLIFKLKKYKNRFGFFIGITIFFALLFFLTNYIWIINVSGNQSLSSYKIIESCKKIGIYEGVKKTKIESKYDAQRLQLIEDGIAWCSLNIEGCVLTVNVSETTISDKNSRQEPSNLKASIEGKIKKIDVTSGNVLVKVGDVVSKGDLLVSGIVDNFSSTTFMHSSGQIIAETKRVFSAEGDFSQKLITQTNKKITHYTIDFFGIKIPLYIGKIKEPYNYQFKINYLSLFGKRIPIKIAKEQFNLTQEKTITYSKEELEKLLRDNIKNQLKNFKNINAVKIDEDIIQTPKGILLKITYICEENIAIQNKILLSKEN